MHYATTGLNVPWLSQQINPGQQITRQQALHAYTRGNAWYLNRENEMGSIEKGKFADLAVLDRDYFTVSDADMRKIRPILTVVAGKVVHDSGVLSFDRNDERDDDDDDGDRGHGKDR
jgi:predicted amidohydrolase YtcJ